MTDRNFTLFDTAIGACGIVWGERGINAVQLPDVERGKDAGTDLPALAGKSRKHRRPPRCRPQPTASSSCWLSKPNDLSSVALDSDGIPEFNRGVYDIARTIPPGKTMTYGDIAKRLGGVELSRDVGQALGRNPAPVVVPCHRCFAAGR